MKSYPDLNILYTTHGSKGYIPPINLSTRQIICSPNYDTEMINEEYVSIKTQHAAYDIQEIIQLLPESQKPDLIVVLIDSFFNNKPMNLKSANCPTVLLIADTHHGQNPLLGILLYLEEEQFNYHILMHAPHHLHWFKEYGLENISFIPNINVHYYNVPFQQVRKKNILFLGQTGKWHPRRKRLIEELQVLNYPISAELCSPSQAPIKYGEHQIIFNCSLNSDFNMRVFEILSAGGFLITDRLSRQTGFDSFFIDGEDLVVYDGLKDLCEKLDYYLERPDLCLKIAQNGMKKYLIHFHPDKQIQQLLNVIFNRGNPSTYYSDYIVTDQRSLNVKAESKETLFYRITLYQYFQNINKEFESVNVLFTEDVDPKYICDVSDLPRISIYRVIGEHNQDVKELFKRVDIVHRINFIEHKCIEVNQWGVIIVSDNYKHPELLSAWRQHSQVLIVPRK